MSEFKSKRNRVWLENGRVHKLILAGAGAATAEFEILKRLYAVGAAVPQVLDLDGDLLILEYVKGMTLTEAVEREIICAVMLAERITCWFAAFYAVFPDRIRGDVNCRNFIITPDTRVFGIDFEDLKYGRKETDLGRLAAFILNDDPPYTDYKKRLAQSLTDCFAAGFGIDRESAAREQIHETEAMRRRRQP